MSDTSNLKKERTLVLLKPDTVQRSLVGELIARIERTGLKLVAMKFIRATEKQILDHYGKDDVWFLEKGNTIVKNLQSAGLPIEKEAIEYGKDIIGSIISFLRAGPLVAMVWEGNQSIGIVKKLVGSTEPLSSDVGTIRGDFTLDSYELANIDARAVRNLVHCTDKKEEAEHEISVWFSPEEILSYRHIAEAMLYDVNLDGIFE